MKNSKTNNQMLAKEFISRIIGLYPIPVIPQITKEAYVKSLSAADLSIEEWDIVADTIQKEDDRWPSAARIWEVIKQTRKLMRAKLTTNKAVLLFGLDGYQTCIYFTWPDEPKIPDRATNARVRILDAVNNILAELPTKEERRAIFRKNFIAEGGKPELADKWFEELDRQARTQLADYDDSLTDDEL